jgi:pimeloyl-ACP methyl ester carboxylesterase
VPSSLLPVVLVPGLACSPRFYAAQIPALWHYGPVTIANHTLDDTITAIAARILATAPPRFALAGHSLGGYIALEIVRQAPERVAKLALLDTSARPEAPEQTARRRPLMEMAGNGRFGEVTDLLLPFYVHASRIHDAALRREINAMADDCGAEAFIRQENAIIGRADMRPTLPAIRCPTLVLVGDSDQPTPPDRASELAAGIAGARLVTIAQCGHMTAMEEPEAVTRALADLLAG